MIFLNNAINSLAAVSSVTLCCISIYFFVVNNVADAIYFLLVATLITVSSMWADLHGEKD